MHSSKYKYDVFVSHAFKDKKEIADELVEKLQKSGIVVWYSGNNLKVGHGIDDTIKDGLNQSKYGIAILTHNYFENDWTKKELNALWSKSKSMVFPIWHNLNKEEVTKYDSNLADKYSLNTKKGIDYVVKELVSSIRESNKIHELENTGTLSSATKKNRKVRFFSKTLLLLILAYITIWFFLLKDIPTNKLIQSAIENRIDSFQKQITIAHISEINKHRGNASSIKQISYNYDQYVNIDTHYRNGYYLNTGYTEFNAKKNVGPLLNINLDSLAPKNHYGFTSPNMFIIDYNPSIPEMNVKCILLNSQSVQFEIIEIQKNDDNEYLVEVEYQNHIRYLSIHFTYSKLSKWMKRKKTTFKGFIPKEIYRFEKEGDQWVFVGVE